MTAPPVLEAIGLRKSFGSIVAVDAIDLELAPGRIYGLLGPNGSGKTTTIRMLAGLARPTSGEARVLGTKMPNRQMLGQIGYMPQAEALYPELSVAENIGFFATLSGAKGERAIERALDLVELAITLVHEPPVLFLDEPTVGVDPALRVQFWTHFRNLADQGTTILVASHVMDEADRCDELIFIRSGRVIARGSGAELRAKAGTDNLETAFLQFSGLDPQGRPIASAEVLA